LTSNAPDVDGMLMNRKPEEELWPLICGPSVDLPGIEPATVDGVTCGNTNLDDATVRGATCRYTKVLMASTGRFAGTRRCPPSKLASGRWLQVGHSQIPIRVRATDGGARARDSYCCRVSFSVSYHDP
jgi:hypothetical protein